MKHLKKAVLLIVALAVLLIPSRTTLAASQKVPANVKKLTASVTSETTVKLTWSKASKATGYYVYSVTESGALKKLGSTTGTACIVKNLKVNKSYTYQIYAYCKSGSTITKSKKGSPAVTVKTKMLTPACPTNLRLASYGEKSVLLKWDAAANATGYDVYRYTEGDKAYKKVATVQTTSCRVKKLTAGKAYRFRIRSYRKVGDAKSVSKYSKVVKGTAKSFKGTEDEVHGRWFSATLKCNLTVTITSTGKKRTLSAGTAVSASKRSSNTVTIILADGQKAKILGSNLSFGNLSYTTRPYSTAAMEAFVNEKGYTSPSNYLIWVSQYTLTTNIFRGSAGEWKLIRSVPCVVGRYGKTPTGVHQLRFTTMYYGYPRIYFTWNPVKGWGNSVHCRIDSNTQAAASDGCVRLDGDTLWYIYNNCPMGTTVVSY